MPLSIDAPSQTVKTGNFGYTTDWSNRTVNLAAGIVAADVGKALAIDATAANTFKLAGDGDVIAGRLEVVENRINEGTLIGTAKLFCAGLRMKVKAADALAAGDYCIGAGAGEIREFVAGDTTAGKPKKHYVTEVAGGYAVVYQ
jgi:hypothetical protein